MKTASILLNLGLSLFTLLVLVTDGIPTEARFVGLSLLFVLVPGLTALVIHRARSTQTWRGPFLIATVVCNFVLLGASCWAFVTQFPSHPKETGLVPYVVFTLVAPALSLLVLGRYLRPPAGEHNATP